ncbi:MAG TPA: ATP-binding protein [Acidimicrobiales bacterium]
MTGAVQFDVPARVEYVGLLRMLVSSLAADRRDLDDEQIDDLRLAVSEACTLVVDNAVDGDARLIVGCQEEPDALILDVHEDGASRGDERGLPDPEHLDTGLPDPERLDEDDGLPLELIRALVDDVSKVSEDGRELIRLRVKCPPARRA